MGRLASSFLCTVHKPDSTNQESRGLINSRSFVTRYARGAACALVDVAIASACANACMVKCVTQVNSGTPSHVNISLNSVSTPLFFYYQIRVQKYTDLHCRKSQTHLQVLVANIALILAAFYSPWVQNRHEIKRPCLPNKSNFVFVLHSIKRKLPAKKKVWGIISTK